MSTVLVRLYRFFFEIVPTFISCLRSGIKFDSTWVVKGRIHVLRRKWYEKFFLKKKGGHIQIGRYFKCNNKTDSNSIGLIQPCVFNIESEGAEIIIGNNVGISGSTINASTRIVIEDNVLIGSGCLITDTDSHPVDYQARLKNDNGKVKKAPIHICEGAFVGARTIILKGVTIGPHSIIGAGSVVTHDIPENSIASGNPIMIKEG